MKSIKFLCLFILITCIQKSAAQSYELRYKYSGSFASVASRFNAVYNGSEIPEYKESLYTKKSYTIPSTITYNDLEYTVNEISDYAFSGATEKYAGSTADSITLSNTIKVIGQYAFRNCNNLNYIDLGGTNTIGQYAFYSCKQLTSIVIPSSVKDIGFQSFTGCNLLREIIYLPAVAPKNWTATSLTYVPDIKSYSKPSFSINNANVLEMITFNQTEFDYSGRAPKTTWNNNVRGYTAFLSMPELKNEVGNHEVWIPVILTDGKDSITANVVYRYTIKPATLKAKVRDTRRVYGEENPEFTISYSGFLNGDNESVITTKPVTNTTATKTSGVGTYPITISGGLARNYDLVYEPGTLTITKAPLSAKVEDATKVYGAQNPAFTIKYYGLKNGEAAPAWTTRPTFQTTATEASGVGQYEVQAMNGVPVNYELGAITTGTLNITPAPLTIKANDVARTYYSENPTLSYTYSGFVNGDSESSLSTFPKVSTTAKLSSKVGTYEIKISDASSRNYSISSISGTLSVTPRTLTASVGNYERLYNENNPAFEVQYTGFVGGENVSVLSSKATASTTATKTSNVGTYPINVSGGSANNYKFSYIAGTLKINKAEQTISWKQDLSRLEVGDQVELMAMATSGLPITYIVGNESIAEIYNLGEKTFLDCKKEGVVSIRAVQEGNNNYHATLRVANIATIGEPGTDVKTRVDSSIKIQRILYGIRVIGASRGDMIQVYTFDGVLQKSIKAEEQITDIPLSNNKVYIIKVSDKTVKLSI